MSQTAHSNTSRGEQSLHRQIFEAFTKEIPSAEVLVISTLPRGGLQILQPQRVAESMTKHYGREFHTEDEISWKAIISDSVVRSNPNSRYVREFLKPFGYEFAAAVPLKAPVLAGYPGAIQAIRSAEQGDFTEAELRKLSEIAKRFENAGAHAERSDDQPAWVHSLETREIIFDSDGKVRAFESAFGQLDDRIRQQMKHEVTQRLKRKSEGPITTDRLLMPDSAGDHWTFNAVLYKSYPALGSGPVVFFCLLPSCPDWSQVRPGDFQADSELSRLVPALKFMQQEYHRGPTLVEISKTLHLSPFHFHRRFTELMGLTPKHFLLECQIHEAKTQLVSGEKGLSQIAADCGFAHQSHFTSRFKQATGLTPTRWRRMAHDRVSGNGNGHGNGKAKR